MLHQPEHLNCQGLCYASQEVNLADKVDLVPQQQSGLCQLIQVEVSP